MMQPHEEYTTFLEQVNTLIERRQSVTATYLSVNAAIVGVMTFILKDAQMFDSGKQLLTLLMLVVGVIICDLWRRLIQQYSKLIGWWYAQLRELEEKLPESSRLLNKEYAELYAQKKSGITPYETRLVHIFVLTYAIFGVVIIGSLLFF